MENRTRKKNNKKELQPNRFDRVSLVFSFFFCNAELCDAGEQNECGKCGKLEPEKVTKRGRKLQNLDSFPMTLISLSKFD